VIHPLATAAEKNRTPSGSEKKMTNTEQTEMEALDLSAAHIKQPRSRESQILITKIQENITNFIAKYTR
jgi:hypothetical protein